MEICPAPSPGIPSRKQQPYGASLIRLRAKNEIKNMCLTQTEKKNDFRWEETDVGTCMSRLQTCGIHPHTRRVDGRRAKGLDFLERARRHCPQLCGRELALPAGVVVDQGAHAYDHEIGRLGGKSDAAPLVFNMVHAASDDSLTKMESGIMVGKG
jgi:hypothetical protein